MAVQTVTANVSLESAKSSRVTEVNGATLRRRIAADQDHGADGPLRSLRCPFCTAAIRLEVALGKCCRDIGEWIPLPVRKLDAPTLLDKLFEEIVAPREGYGIALQ